VSDIWKEIVVTGKSFYVGKKLNINVGNMLYV
jgi:hypothetical protein